MSDRKSSRQNADHLPHGVVRGRFGSHGLGERTNLTPRARRSLGSICPRIYRSFDPELSRCGIHNRPVGKHANHRRPRGDAHPCLEANGTRRVELPSFLPARLSGSVHTGQAFRLSKPFRCLDRFRWSRNSGTLQKSHALVSQRFSHIATFDFGDR
jgi:hypothetical protein